MTTLKLLAELEISNKRIDEIINAVVAERDTLKQQNAELAAQVSLLRASMSDALKMHKAEVFTKDSWDLCFDEFEAILDATPAQCLLEVKADAGRDGYIAGYEGGHMYRFANIADELADEYANKIREGKQ